MTTREPNYDAVLLDSSGKEHRAITRLPTLDAHEVSGAVNQRAVITYKLEHGGYVTEQPNGLLLDSRGREYMLM